MTTHVAATRLPDLNDISYQYLCVGGLTLPFCASQKKLRRKHDQDLSRAKWAKGCIYSSSTSTLPFYTLHTIFRFHQKAKQTGHVLLLAAEKRQRRVDGVWRLRPSYHCADLSQRQAEQSSCLLAVDRGAAERVMVRARLRAR